MTTGTVVYEEAAYVVLAPGAARCARNTLTLLPKTHVAVLSELSPDAMASVLAGLTRLTVAVKEACASDEVAIRTHPKNEPGRHGHVHFHPVPKNSRQAVVGEQAGREMTESTLLSIAEAMSHTPGGLVRGEPSAPA